MEFYSPDVEKEFPGLYTSEAARKPIESDYSDDQEKSFKSDVTAKKKDKKDSKKELGYAALEGESSPDEGDAKSPSKSKKSKSFKFPVKNKSEKREKSRDKENKEKEKKKDLEKKEKIKSKDKKKSKAADEHTQSEHAIFGVPLEKAVERSGCLDGVGIPLPVRHCIDCIHTAGLSCETLYKTPPVKSKLQTIKKSYNAREPVSTADMDVAMASGLLWLFLRELPDHILTVDMVARFEEAAATQEVSEREEKLSSLLAQLPACNRELVAWLMVHFDHVTQHEELNKINAQSIAMTFSPILQMSHRLLTAFLCHCKSLFAETVIHKYIPPLPPGSSFPDEPNALALELTKQEALLNQLHRDMSEGFISTAREEQLWEVQRIVTQLKRKLKGLQKKNDDASKMQKSMDEETFLASKSEEKKLEPRLTGECKDNDHVVRQELKVTQAETVQQPIAEKEVEKPEVVLPEPVAVPSQQEVAMEPLQAQPAVVPRHELPSVSSTELRLQLENTQLHQLHAKLQDRLDQERRWAAKYRTQIETYRGFIDSDSDESSAASTPAYLSPETEARFEQLIEENQMLMAKRDELTRKIMEEREACIKLNVSINYIELMNRT